MELIDSESFDIRYTQLDDTPTLRKILKTSNMLHFFLPSTEEELEHFIRVWIGFSRYGASLTAVFENKAIGMATLLLMPYRKVAHQCMFQIVIDPAFQRQKVGTSLLKNLIHLAKHYFHLDLLHIEVLDDSPLIVLLKQLHFTQFGRQENYIKENGKYFPRILMELDLT